MVYIRSPLEIIQNLIDYFKLAQPNLNTAPGSVARDLMIEAPAAQLGQLYDALNSVSNLQSLRLCVGTDLDKLALNFGLTRKQSTPSSGVALLTFSSLNAAVNINQGANVYSNTGISFAVSTGQSLVPSNLNFYRSVATQYSAQLAYIGITDQYAVQVTVTSLTAGSASNIGQYTINSTTIPGISNATNVVAFAGGTDQETDAAFRNRILATFSGSSVGTSLGYLNAALSVTGVQDATVIGPGNPLMTRDGTISEIENGVPTIISEGSGGKVDVVVLGSVEQQGTDTFIYQDKSNKNDPTNPANNWVLGQILSNAGMTINQKRIVDINAGILPAQPVDALLQVTASISGGNFVPQTTDGYGRVSGNYNLIKDTGVYGGSCFGFDTFAWTSNQIDFQEDLIKGQTNGQDPTTFTDVLQITDAQQYLNISNENSIVTTDRSIIQLLHTPATNITSVFNINTGENYIITNQNYDNTSPFNNTGRIQISGNTLPSPSNTLQVNYTWVVDFDRYSDFDGLVDTDNIRPVSNSIDWGYASDVHGEVVNFTTTPGNNFFTGNASHPIDTVVSANTFLQVDGYVQQITSGTFANRFYVVFTNLAVPITSVNSIELTNSNVELYNTAQANGTITNTAIVVGINVLYMTTIILPSDTVATLGQYCTGYLNLTNVFQSSTVQGSSNGTQITVPASLLTTSIGENTDSVNLLVYYVANVANLYSSAITSVANTLSLPASRIGNGYILSDNNGFNNFSIVNISRRENQIVQLNGSNQYYVELNLPITSYTLIPQQILSVIRLTDGVELWNPDNLGQVINGSDGNFQLIFTGFNTPAANDRVLVIYYATDIGRFQPFSFSNSIIKTRIDHLAFDGITNSFTVPLVNFTAQSSGLYFEIVDENSDNVFFTVSDGYLTLLGNTEASISSPTVNFGTLDDLGNKRVKINAANTPNNDGYFNILSYNASTNDIIITSQLSNIGADQIDVIRILDGQELWSYAGTIDQVNNRLLIPNTPNAVVNDLVFTMFFDFKNLRQAPTRIIATTQDTNTNTGIMTIAGTTMALAENIVFTATSTGLLQNLQQALATALNISTTATIPNNIRIAKIVNLQKVSTYAQGSNIVLETLVNYDVINTYISNNLYFANEMLSNPTLSGLEFMLPNTTNNTMTIPTNNLPTLGDQLQVSFYYTIDSNSESLNFSSIGTLYTNNKFALIDQIYVSSGFNASQSTILTLSSFTKPSVGFRYTIYYDYLAPKQNEQIVIQYNFNQLVATTTFAVEASRPINADVLTRAAKEVELDLTMNVVIATNSLSTSTSVLQTLRNQLINALTATQLGQTIDQITLINIAQGVSGIARARILYFNITGQQGTILSFTANQDQYFVSNNIIINTESL